MLCCLLGCGVVSWCAVFSGHLVRCLVLRYVGCVGLSCPAALPLLLSLLLSFLLLPGPLSRPVVVSVLVCGAVLFCCAVYRVLRCCLRRFLLVVLRCLVRAGWCRVLLPVVSGCSLLRLVARCRFPVACLVTGVPVWPRGLLPCCVLWFVVVPCSPVLCPVVLCCRVVLCCGSLLSVLLCWWCWFVSFPCVCVAVLGYAGSRALVPIASVLFLVPRDVV